MIANYTTEELSNIKDKIDIKLYDFSNKLFNKVAFGINCLHLCQYYHLWLYKQTINDWKQNQDGSTDDIYNSISREQFYNILTETLNLLK